jgi:hypothetical protein
MDVADGSAHVVGIDAQNFPCNEWTNFLGYEPQPPNPDEFPVKWVDYVGYAPLEDDDEED